MSWNSILVGFAVVAFAAMVCAGCSDDGGETDGPQALSLNGDTSVAATGGAAIAVDYGLGFTSVVSSMLGALVIDAGVPPSNASVKILVDEALPLCTNPTGTALLSGNLTPHDQRNVGERDLRREVYGDRRGSGRVSHHLAEGLTSRMATEGERP